MIHESLRQAMKYFDVFFFFSEIIVCLHIYIIVLVLVTESFLMFCTPWTVAHRSSLAMGFSSQECWSGLPFISSRDLPNPGLNSSLLQCLQILYCLSHEGSPYIIVEGIKLFLKDQS